MSGSPPFLRNSERTTFRRCPQKWWWGYREGLTGKYEQADALWFGTGWHEALAQWYRKGAKRGKNPAKFWADWVGSEIAEIRTSVSEDFNEDVFVDARELGIAMFNGYLAKFGRDDDWDVIATEQPFQIEIPFPGKHDKVLVVLAGTFDGVYRDRVTGEIWLMEHKTAKQISTAHLYLDDQAGTYWLVASQVLREQGLIERGEELAGIMYNHAKKAMPDPRPEDERGRKLNKDGSMSKVQPGPLFVRTEIERGPRERATQLRRIQDEALIMRGIVRGKIPLIKNTTWNCHWDCPFFDMCQLHEKGGSEWEVYRDAMFTRRDMYADHRKSAASE